MFAKTPTVVPGWVLASSAAVVLGVITVMLTSYRLTEVDVHSGATRQHRVFVGAIRVSIPSRDRSSPLRFPPDVSPEWHGARADFRFSGRHVGWRHGGTRGDYRTLQASMDEGGLSDAEMLAASERARPHIATGRVRFGADHDWMLYIETREGGRINLVAHPQAAQNVSAASDGG